MAKNELSSIAVSAFCENLAMMLEAGIQPDEAAALLAEDTHNPLFHKTAQTMQESLLLGSTLSEAAKNCGTFPPYVVKMIAAGEASGRTDAVLRSLARHYSAQDQLQKKLKSAVVYPGLLLGLMALILIVLLSQVLPVFTGVYNRFAGNVASSSFAYIQFAYGVGWFALVITLLLAALLVFCLVTARTTKGRSRLSGLFELLPLTSSASRKLAVARFTSTLSIFIASGVDVDTALDAADGMVDHGETHEKIQKCKISMSKGSGLATAIFNEKVFEPLYGRMLLSGARSGNLEQVLARLSDLFTQDANNALDSLIDSIEPLLAGFLTISVGVTLLSVMLPLIGILGTIG